MSQCHNAVNIPSWSNRSRSHTPMNVGRPLLPLFHLRGSYNRRGLRRPCHRVRRCIQRRKSDYIFACNTSSHRRSPNKIPLGTLSPRLPSCMVPAHPVFPILSNTVDKRPMLFHLRCKSASLCRHLYRYRLVSRWGCRHSLHHTDKSPTTVHHCCKSVSQTLHLHKHMTVSRLVYRLFWCMRLCMS